MFRFLQNLFNLSEIKLPPASDIIFMGKPYSEKIILNANIRLSSDRSSVFFDDKELAVIIYNAKVVSII